MIGENKLRPTDRTDFFKLRLAVGPYNATFDLTGDLDNPFDLSMFSNFKRIEKF